MPDPSTPQETETTAQDVVDALRLALMSQDDPVEADRLTRALLEMAPETDSDRGVRLLTDLICEGSLKAALKEEAPSV